MDQRELLFSRIDAAIDTAAPPPPSGKATVPDRLRLPPPSPAAAFAEEEEEEEDGRCDDGHGGGSPGASSQRRDGADCGDGPGAVPGGGSAEEAGDDGPDDDGSDDDGSTSSSSSSGGSTDSDHDGVRSLLLRAERRLRAQSAFEEVKELRSEVTRHQTLAESTLRVNRSLRKQVDDLEGKLEGYRRAVSVLKRNELRAEERRAANEAEYMNQLNDLVQEVIKRDATIIDLQNRWNERTVRGLEEGRRRRREGERRRRQPPQEQPAPRVRVVVESDSPPVEFDLDCSDESDGEDDAGSCESEFV